MYKRASVQACKPRMREAALGGSAPGPRRKLMTRRMCTRAVLASCRASLKPARMQSEVSMHDQAGAAAPSALAGHHARSRCCCCAMQELSAHSRVLSKPAQVQSHVWKQASKQASKQAGGGKRVSNQGKQGSKQASKQAGGGKRVSNQGKQVSQQIECLGSRVGLRQSPASCPAPALSRPASAPGQSSGHPA